MDTISNKSSLIGDNLDNSSNSCFINVPLDSKLYFFHVIKEDDNRDDTDALIGSNSSNTARTNLYPSPFAAWNPPGLAVKPLYLCFHLCVCVIYLE